MDKATDAAPTKEEKRRRPRDWPGRFLAALAQTGIVKSASEDAGIDRATAYRRKATDPDFSDRWNEAIDIAVESLELEARRRAHDGTERPVFYQGSQCGSVREYSDTLLIFTLKALRPEKYRDAAATTNIFVNDERQAADPDVAKAALEAAASVTPALPTRRPPHIYRD